MMHEKRNYKFAWGESDSMFTLVGVKIHTDARHVLATEPRNFVIVCKNRMAKAYYLESDLKNALKVGSKVCQQKEMKKYFTGCKKTERDFLKFIEKLNSTKIESSSNIELVNYLKKYLELLVLLFAYYQITTVPEYLDVAHKKLKKIVKDDNTVDTLIQPHELTEVELSEIGLLKISFIKNINKSEILKYLNRFPQLAYNTYNEKEIIDFVIRKINEIKKFSKQERINKIKKIIFDKQKLKKEQKDLLEKYNSSVVNFLSKTIQDLGVWRFKLKKHWSGAEFLIAKLFTEISCRAKIDLKTLMWVYSYEDVKNVLLKNKPLSKKEVSTRKKSYTLNLQDGKLELLTGKKEKDFLDRYIKKHPVNRRKELHGSIANKGRAKGRVKIIHVSDLNQLKKDEKIFKSGQILVTTMTQVNIVHIIKKAAAILTEQGGITCHAAIISRELNKPCIVEIENLTSVLHDGDLVEVDANKGIVKIFKK